MFSKLWSFFCVNTARFKKELYLRILNEACLFVNQINSSGLRVVSYFTPLRSVDISLLRCTRQPNESKFLSKVARTQHRKWKCSVKLHEPEIKAARNICFYLEILLGDLS